VAKPFDLSLPGVSKHLKVLQRAGLVTQSCNAQWPPCRLEAARLQEAAVWVGEFLIKTSLREWLTFSCRRLTKSVSTPCLSGSTTTTITWRTPN
jgi:DNA-binding transcriptional ArsR family regulator